MTVTIHRHQEAGQCNLLEAASDILERATYAKDACVEKAPETVDCLTMVHYIFKRSVGIEPSLTYIGSMPGQLHTFGWNVLDIPITALRDGDIIFATAPGRAAFITHAAIFVTGIGGLEGGGFLHVTQKLGHAEVLSPNNFLRHYRQILTAEWELLHIDPRDYEQLALTGKPFRKEAPTEPIRFPDEMPSRSPSPQDEIGDRPRSNTGTKLQKKQPLHRTLSWSNRLFGLRV